MLLFIHEMIICQKCEGLTDLLVLLRLPFFNFIYRVHNFILFVIIELMTFQLFKRIKFVIHLKTLILVELVVQYVVLLFVNISLSLSV